MQGEVFIGGEMLAIYNVERYIYIAIKRYKQIKSMSARKAIAPRLSKSTAPKVLSDEALALIAARFRALSEPVRLRLLNTLMEGERSVGQLVEAAGTGQANVSKHLAVLREAGMVATRREGLSTLCSIADPVVMQLCEIMCARLKAEHEERGRALG
jgi:ArsR family transcriptional regulator